MTPGEGHSHRRPVAPVDVLTPSSFLVQLPVVDSGFEQGAKNDVWILCRCLWGHHPGGSGTSFRPCTAGDGEKLGSLSIAPRYGFWGLFQDAKLPLREILISNELQQRPTARCSRFGLLAVLATLTTAFSFTPRRIHRWGNGSERDSKQIRGVRSQAKHSAERISGARHKGPTASQVWVRCYSVHLGWLGSVWRSGGVPHQ